MKKQINWKRGGSYAVSIIQSLTGGFLLFVFGICVIAMLAADVIHGTMLAAFVVFAALDILGIFLIVRGHKNRVALTLAGRLMPMFDTVQRIKLEHASAKTGYPAGKLLKHIGRLKKNGLIENIYVTSDNLWLVYCEGIFIESAEDKKNPKPDTPDPENNSPFESYIRELTDLDWKMTNELMAKSVHEILIINRSIFEHIKQRPEKLPQLKRLIHYYLPTTIKLLKNYDDLNRQANKGENIRETMRGIEGIIESVTDTFKREHDKLYKDIALDISTDIEVLRAMMDRHGLSGNSDFMVQ